MKKMITVFLAIILVLALVACNNDNATTEPTNNTTAGNNHETNTTEDNTPTHGATDATESTDNTTVTNPTENTTAGGDPTDRDEKDETNTTVPTVPSVDPTNPNETTKPTEPHKHSYNSTITDATCTNDGYTTHTCACGDTYEDNKTQATGHQYGEWKTVNEPTTSAKGKAERTCSKCGYVDTKDIAKLVENHKHSYTSTVTTVATCTKTGVRTYKCSCGDTYTESIAKTAHNYSTTVTKPTCTSDGYTTYKCNCGASYNGAKTNALGHNYKDSITKPTCEDGGYTTHTCERCGIFYVDTRTNATGHNYSTKQTKAPTCTVSGVNTHTCSTCKHSYTTPIAAIGHNYYVSSDTKATCTSDGKKVETCRNCGDNKTVATYPATGHKHTRKEETNSTCSTKGYVKTICTDCGQTVSATEKALLPHSFSKEMILSDAVKVLQNNGNNDYGRWIAYSEWKVDVCTNCGVPNMDSMRYAYTEMEAAQIMLGYVNDLRAEVYGSHKYDMQVNEHLMEIANIRAKELVTNFSHYSETPKYGAMENIAHDNLATPLLTLFNDWKNSTGHYAHMVNTEHEYFAFATCFVNDGYWYSTGAAYGVQLFWDWYDLYEYERIHGLL